LETNLPARSPQRKIGETLCEGELNIK